MEIPHWGEMRGGFLVFLTSLDNLLRYNPHQKPSCIVIERVEQVWVIMEVGGFHIFVTTRNKIDPRSARYCCVGLEVTLGPTGVGS
jgi:hypothetical protein